MTPLQQLKKEYTEAAKYVREIEKRKKQKSFYQLSRYSQNLLNEEHKNAVSKQFDIIEKIVDFKLQNKITQKQAEQIVKTHS